MRANISVIALATSGLVASCFYGSATLIDSQETAGTGGNSSQGGQSTGSGGLLNNAGTSSSARTAGSAGKVTNPGVSGSAGAGGGKSSNTAGAAGYAINRGGSGGRSVTTIAGSAGTAGVGACNGESCGTTVLVPGGTFVRGNNLNEGECAKENFCETSEMPKAKVKISSFYLDKYEVTVGRFRQFLKDYDYTKPPQPGAGANPSITSKTASTTGWSSAWNNKLLPKDKLLDSLRSKNCEYSTWPTADEDNDLYPINCIDWYTAFAFCIWDGGRLPTEAEWEYVAAGGDKDQIYPWGNDDPSIYPDLAWFYPAKTPHMVGLMPKGGGLWGHLDLGGNVFEWTLDSFASYGAADSTLDNPVNIGGTEVRSARGGSADDGTNLLRAAARYSSPDANMRIAKIGVRCARNAK